MQVTLMLFFFFQAEDGIRDKLVTGVQTCALPISFQRALVAAHGRIQMGGQIAVREAPREDAARSEEHTSELQSLAYLVCRLLLEKKKTSELASLAYFGCRPRHGHKTGQYQSYCLT